MLEQHLDEAAAAAFQANIVGASLEAVVWLAGLFLAALVGIALMRTGTSKNVTRFTSGMVFVAVAMNAGTITGHFRQTAWEGLTHTCNAVTDDIKHLGEPSGQYMETASQTCGTGAVLAAVTPRLASPTTRP